MPPGTGDVPLTVFQSLPVDGILIVTSPQDLVSMIVSKAVKMAQMMHIPVLGFVENYSYLRCPDCGKKIEVFGKSKLQEVAEAFGLPVLAQLPIDPKVAESFDNGLMETVDTEALAAAIKAVEEAE
jgi:Mrp family chromosome partitioning ATPase